MSATPPSPSVFADRFAPRPMDGQPLEPELLLDIAAALARARTLWSDRVRHDRPERHAVRLVADGRFEAWLIGWPPGHRTTSHDHGESVGALAVVEGSLLERTVDADGPRARRLSPGSVSPLGAGLVHDVATPVDAPATSIHVYSPPLATMTFYEDGSGVPDRVLAVADETPLLDGRELARLLHPSAAAGRG